MRWNLTFDRGTLVFDCPYESLPPALANSFVWDERVAKFRGEACRYHEIVSLLTTLQQEVKDDVFSDSVSTGSQFSDNVFMARRLSESFDRVSLRDYQGDALLSWQTSNRRGVICLPTGAGKTRVAIAAIAATKVPTLCLVPTRVLLDQWIECLKPFYGGPIGKLGDGSHDVQDVTVSTYESAYQRMQWLGARFQLLVIDEVHHFGGSARDEALVMSIAPFRLGLTATKPDDEERLAVLGRLVGPVTFELGMRDLTGSHLADFVHIPVSVSLTVLERLRYDRDWEVFTSFFKAFMRLYPKASWSDFLKAASKSEAGKSALSGFHRAKRIVSYTEGKRSAIGRILGAHPNARTLIFTSDAATAYKVAKEFLVPTITAEVAKKEREDILLDFKEGRLNALVSCRVLNEGLDVPDADLAIIVGGSSSGREHVQRIGRLLRPSIGKEAHVYEIVAADTYEVRHAQKRCSYVM